MKSQRTIDVTKKRNIFGFISYFLWITVVLVLVFFTFKKFSTPVEIVESAESEGFISESGKAFILSTSITVIIGVIATIVIKDKLRTFFWMVSVVLSAVIFKSTGMYIVLGIWLVDEYVFHNLYKYYKSKVSINKEIDLRQ